MLLTALPPPDLGFHTTIARLGGVGGREHHAHREDAPSDPRAGEQERHRSEADADPLARENHDDRGDQEEHEARQKNVSCVPAPLHCLPRCHRAGDEQHHHNRTTWEITNDLNDADDDTGQEEHQCYRSCNSPGDHSIAPSVGAPCSRRLLLKATLRRRDAPAKQCEKSFSD